MMFSIFVVEDNDAIIGSLRRSNDLFPSAFGCCCLASLRIGAGAPDTHVITV